MQIVSFFITQVRTSAEARGFLLSAAFGTLKTGLRFLFDADR